MSDAVEAAREGGPLALLTLDDSSSDEESVDGTSIIDSVRSGYAGEGLAAGTGTLYHIEQALQAGALSCLVCISSVKRKDPIWSCRQCYTLFHLVCVAQWARDSLLQRERARDALPAAAAVRLVLPDSDRPSQWNCPKCRLPYTKECVPREYVCFCGAEREPRVQPWLVPHSCGALCRKPLQPPCSHTCLLLCHPGPCPPCPRFINTACHCGRGVSKSVRCSAGGWACEERCARRLECGSHACPLPCHGGACPPCVLTVARRCVCGHSAATVPCDSPPWQCSQVCKKLLSCGSHECERACHAPGDCRPCPLSEETTCPCGAERRRVRCPEPAPLCGGTCGKPLPCATHACPDKCHRGPCPPCVQVVSKACGCGATRRSVPCGKEFRCQTKCALPVCERHACGRRCCTQCGPCERPCSKPLSCRKHRCTMVCHSGPCYPCPQQSRLACPCGSTSLMVACGRSKVKLPLCTHPCKRSYSCGHEEANVHRCHAGECPPCALPCDVPLPCGHRCPERCHRAVKLVIRQTKAPATPVDIQAPRVQECRLECAPCVREVRVACLGAHEVSAQRCFEARARSCGRACARPLPCTNHTCARPCHQGEESECERCERACEVRRPAHCAHGCPRGGCHAPPCPPCARAVRLPCHCGLQQLQLSCDVLARLPADPALASCAQRCYKTMECGHRCASVCHAGACSAPRDCRKPVRVPCPCGTVKLELPCNQGGSDSVECGAACAERAAAEREARAREEAERRAREAERDRRELEQYERMFRAGRRRQRAPRAAAPPSQRASLFSSPYCLLALSALALAAAAAAYSVYTLVLN